MRQNGTVSSSARTPTHSVAVTAAIVVVCVVAVLVFLLRLVGGDTTLLSEIWGALALGIVIAAPAILALLALNGRTSLLLPAAVIAFFGSPIVSILFVFLGAAAVVWIWAYVRTSPKGSIRLTFVALVVVPALWFVSAATPFVHLDPVCEETLDDGTVRRVENVGSYSGWIWDAPSTETSTSIVGAEVAHVVCTSDEITPIEAVVVALFVTGSIVAGMAIIRREDALVR